MLGTGQVYTEQTWSEPDLCHNTHHCFPWKTDAGKEEVGQEGKFSPKTMSSHGIEGGLKHESRSKSKELWGVGT